MNSHDFETYIAIISKNVGWRETKFKQDKYTEEKGKEYGEKGEN